jgi:hypothetical protein
MLLLLPLTFFLINYNLVVQFHKTEVTQTEVTQTEVTQTEVTQTEGLMKVRLKSNIKNQFGIKMGTR